MSIVDTTDGDSINSNGLMVKDKRSKTGYKKASDRKVKLLRNNILCIFRIFKRLLDPESKLKLGFCKTVKFVL